MNDDAVEAAVLLDTMTARKATTKRTNRRLRGDIVPNIIWSPSKKSKFVSVSVCVCVCVCVALPVPINPRNGDSCC
jgi:hypothetical protein